MAVQARASFICTGTGQVINHFGDRDTGGSEICNGAVTIRTIPPGDRIAILEEFIRDPTIKQKLQLLFDDKDSSPFDS